MDERDLTTANGNGEVGGATPVEAPREVLPRDESWGQAAGEAPVVPTPRRRRCHLRVTWRGVRTAGVRVYSGALVLGIAGACLMALVYLFKAVFTPAALPADFAQWQGRLDPAALRQEHIAGVTTEAGRAPMVHYHKVDRWFAADPRNTCTAAGCHSPLPHSPKAAVAAFPNLHVTFLDCAVCHEPIDGGPLEVRWIASATGRPQEAPAVLRLTRLLEGLNGGEVEAVKAHLAIVALLKEMVGAAGRDTEIEDLLIQIESSVPHSPFWRKSVQELRRVLPLHARGEYGAKMARDYTATEPAITARLTREYFATAEGSARRKEVGRQIHAKIVARPGACSTCHAEEGGRLNFLAAGYSPERARALRALPLARMVEQIRAGESFQLPRVMEAGDGR